jgi:hypothetical protein
MTEEGGGFDINYKVPAVDLYASYTLPGYKTLPRIASHQRVRKASTEESYKDWMYSRDSNPNSHKKLNFDRIHWETQSLIDGGFTGDKDGIDVRKYHNPEHPASTAWWWADKDPKDREVYNARLRQLKRYRPDLSEPLIRAHSISGSLNPITGPKAQDDATRRRDRRAARKAEKQALWNEIWKLETNAEEKRSLFDALWEEQKLSMRAQT